MDEDTAGRQRPWLAHTAIVVVFFICVERGDA